jgi:Fe2+ or Zn2+ uptake regulation protein
MAKASRRDHSHQHQPPAGPAALRPSGRRLTKQRQLIWTTLVENPGVHLSADDIVKRVQAELPRTNPSTVYRTLDLLVQERLVIRADLGADRVYYELTTDHPHHHVVCERCGAVAHIHDEGLGTLRRSVESVSGYRLGSREITLHGLCPDCWAALPARADSQE